MAGTNLLSNGSFESGTAPWFVQTAGTTAQAAGIRRALTQLPVHIAVANPNTPRAADWEAAIQKQGLNLTSGQPLLISFQARAKRPTTVRWSIIKDSDPWTEYQTNTASVKSTWQSFTYRWTPTATTAGAAAFALSLGGESSATWKDNEYWIDDVTVAPIVNNQADTSLVFDSFESGPVVDCPAASTPTQPMDRSAVAGPATARAATTVKREYGAYWTTGKGESLRMDEAAVGDCGPAGLGDHGRNRSC